MNFGFSDEQEMLQKSARSFLEKECPSAYLRKIIDDDLGYGKDLWAKITEMGWTGLVFPEKYGGLDLGMVDLAVVAEEMGRALLPSPFFPTIVLAGMAIRLGGTEAQRKELLPSIISGETIAALAITEPGLRLDAAGIATKATADRKTGGFVLDGVKTLVHGAYGADLLVVAARTKATGKPEQAITLFLVDAKAPGVTITPLKAVDATRRVAEVKLRGVKVGKDAVLGKREGAWPVIQAVLDRAIVVLSAEEVGSAQKCLEMTVDYAKTRIQYGKPIGSFQAIKHPCADMMLEVESAKSAVYYAAWAIDAADKGARVAASMAKAYAGEAAFRVAARSIQLHGGIGFTWEHDLHFHFKRAKTTELTFGDGKYHRERVAQGIGL
jgi:alkylation response protein AidB-like acyl-CoA dehydrogenase